MLIENPIGSHPFIKLQHKSPKIELDKEMTLNDLEQKLKSVGEVKRTVNFIAPDGALIAKGSKVHHILHIPYIVMKIDGVKEYNILSEKSFSLRNVKFTLNSHEKIIYDTCKELGMRDQKAIEIAQFVSLFEKEISHKTEVAQSDLLTIVREVLAMKAKNVKEEKEILLAQLELLKRQREPMLNTLTAIEKKAEISAKRVVVSFVGIILV